MQKNVASQKLIVFAFDSTTNAPKSGDAANITAYVSIDYGSVTVLGDTSATEMDAANAKGYYLFDLAQAETNGNTLVFTAKSSTSNIVVIGVPATAFTDPANYPLASIDTSGVVKANLAQILGTALTETAGQIAAGFKKFFDIATPAATMDHGILVDTATVLTALTVTANAEPTSVPASNATLAAKLSWVFMLMRNKITQTAATQTVFANDTTTPVATSTVSDDATTATRGKYV